MNILLINNHCIKKILLYFFQREKINIKDYELFLLKNSILSLLKNNNQNYFECNVNNCVESYNNISRLYFNFNEFNINETIKTILDIIFNNKTYNYSYIYEFEIYNICKIIDLYNNKIININNSIFNPNENILNTYLFDNPNKIIEKINLKVFNMNNSINNTISQNHSNFHNVINDRNSSFEKKKNIFKIITKSSRYKGVTKNKKKWQAYIRIKNKNIYLGSYSSEKTAAKIYDIMLIKKNGIKAKTNFKYTRRQIKIISKVIDFDNIFDIIKN